MTEELRDAILTVWDASAKELFDSVLAKALTAYKELTTLDDALYRYYVHHGRGLLHTDDPAEALIELSAETFFGLRGLVDHLKTRGFLEGNPTSDIQVLSEEVRAESVATNPAERLDESRTGSARVGATLSQQLDAFQADFDRAIEDDDFAAALRAVDDYSDVFVDGLVALLTTICRPYLPEFDPEEMLPGHKSNLEKAVVVRRGLADLRRSIDTWNERIGGDMPDELIEITVEQVRKRLEKFVRKETFQLMRPADRFEMDRLHKTLTEGKKTKKICMELADYLRSMLVINQRAVVAQHDRETARDLILISDAVAPLKKISAAGVAALARDAIRMLERLYGVSDTIDSLAVSLRKTPPSFDDLDSIIRTMGRIREAASTVYKPRDTE